MGNLLKLIIFCAICTLASGSYFDWRKFSPKPGRGVDFNLRIERLQLNDRYVRYLIGNVTYKVALSESTKIEYDLTPYPDDDSNNKRSACDHYFDEKYLKPFSENSDYKSPTTCPIDSNTYTFNPVTSLSELQTRTELEEGSYSIVITYSDENGYMGGFSGQFYCVQYP